MRILIMVALLVFGGPACAVSTHSFVGFDPNGDVTLAAAGKAAPLYVDSNDYPGVLRAATDLRADVQRVTGTLPALHKGATPAGRDVVIVGTVGKSALIDALVAAGKLDVSAIRGKWEGWQVQTLQRPMPGVDRALVIAGSDKRGTIFGIYELSEQIGVSPWYWWADVPPTRHAALSVTAPKAVSDAPVVRYRGIFLNDEAPALTGWAKEKFGGYNQAFYEKVFELLLRMRANYLWPAMWDAAFYADDKDNGRLADDYGIVMGTSHHEPMMRAHKEWQRTGKGPWDYSRNAGVLQEFWRGGLRGTRDYEKVITLGMRGDGDEPMSRDANVALLEKIVADQRDMIRQEIDPDVTKVPQLWALYKEVQEYYEQGMRVPDDVLLLWCDDNWGNIRRLPTPEERHRPGGAGIYYHFDYVGGPRSYKWLNVTPLPKVWEQMHLAWQYDATRMWIVNVGDLKPMEVPTEFFLGYAWDPARWPADRLQDYLRQWATSEFGATHARDIADIVAKYATYNSRRRPEMLEPGTYSLVNYDEWGKVVTDYNAIVARAEAISAALPRERRDAFYQLVLHPAKASAVVNELHATAARNALYAKQGRAEANALAARARALFAEDAALTRRYHAQGNGKWNHMMAQTHLGYTYWNQPPVNVMPPVSEVHVKAGADMGIAVEGDEHAWPGPETEKLALPALDVHNRQPRHIEIFNRGAQPFDFTVRAVEPWLQVSQARGTVRTSQRIAVDARWGDVPAGANAGTVLVAGLGREVRIRVPVHKPTDGVKGFVETGGVVSIEAPHHARAVAAPGRQWLALPGHGRTLGGVTTLPAAAPALSPQDGMRLEYDIHTFTAGPATVNVTLAPTLNFQPGHGLRFAVSFDDEAPQIVDMHADVSLAATDRRVADGAAAYSTRHTLAKPGAHVLKFWALDAGVVLQKVVVDLGGQKPSYLGPPESPRVQ